MAEMENLSGMCLWKGSVEIMTSLKLGTRLPIIILARHELVSICGDLNRRTDSSDWNVLA